MPHLEDNLSSLTVHCVCDLFPHFNMAVIKHHQCMRPFPSIEVDKGTFHNNETDTVTRALGIVVSAGLCGLVSIDTAVSGHGAHTDVILQRDCITQSGELQDV